MMAEALKEGTMKKDAKVARATLRRRDVLRSLGIGAGAAATASTLLGAQTSVRNGTTADEKRKARYRADSPEVQTYYRVNRYSK
jgi:hypothetical protein